jgi:hypothetical protein
MSATGPRGSNALRAAHRLQGQGPLVRASTAKSQLRLAPIPPVGGPHAFVRLAQSWAQRDRSVTKPPNDRRRPAVGIRAPATTMSESMTRADLDKRAELTVWPGQGPAHVAQGHQFPTLREALAAAVEAMDAADAQPWIITEDGDILAPSWIRANTASCRLQ